MKVFEETLYWWPMPEPFDLWWKWWIQDQVDNFNRFLFCSCNSSRFFDWNFDVAIVNTINPISINRSKNSSTCIINSIPNFYIIFKSKFDESNTWSRQQRMFQQLQFYQIGTMEYQQVVIGVPETCFCTFSWVSWIKA